MGKAEAIEKANEILKKNGFSPDGRPKAEFDHRQARFERTMAHAGACRAR